MGRIKEMLMDKENGICPFCGERVNIDSFTTKKSIEEFKLSGLCQKCQNKFFGD